MAAFGIPIILQTIAWNNPPTIRYVHSEAEMQSLMMSPIEKLLRHHAFAGIVPASMIEWLIPKPNVITIGYPFDDFETMKANVSQMDKRLNKIEKRLETIEKELRLLKKENRKPIRAEKDSKGA